MNSDIKYLSDNNYISHIKNQYLICISEESFNNLFNEEKEDLLNALYRFIINEEIYLYQIPSFLLKEKEILLAIANEVWNKEDNEIDKIKELLFQSNLSKDFNFVMSLFDCDDGSLALIIADTSIRELEEFWFQSLKSWHGNPKKSMTWEDALISYSILPEKFKLNLDFNKRVIESMPEFYGAMLDDIRQDNYITQIAVDYFKVAINRYPDNYSTLHPDLKNSVVLCAAALDRNGLLLAEMPDVCRANPELAYIAIKQNPIAMELIHDDLTYDAVFIKKTLSNYPEALKHAIPRVKYLYEHS